MRIMLFMIAIISDVHANFAALDAVVNHALRFNVDRFLCLGDVVGYGPHPRECIELLRSLNTANLLGNHDKYITGGLASCRSKFVARLIEFHKSLLDASHLDWLSTSKATLSEETCLFMHGGPKDPCEQYLYEISEKVIPKDVSWLFTGHTHVQIVAGFNNAFYCNPGSVGQPRDGDCRAAYATFDGFNVELHRIEYDIDKTANAMKRLGFPPDYYMHLYDGKRIDGRVDAIRILKKD
jgi:predicted phosphodiesterase